MNIYPVTDICTDCGAPAACRYDWGTGIRYACADCDPLRPGLTASVRVPPFYQSLPLFPVTMTSGQGFVNWGNSGGSCTCTAFGLGTARCPVHQGAQPSATWCNCPPCWGGLCPPPACPAHGQTEMIQVRC